MKKLLIISILLICYTHAFTQKTATSVLFEGQWFKINISQNGVYKISYQDMLIWGVISSPMISETIGLFGQPAGMLNESLETTFTHDINELSIKMMDNDDGSFDPGDYFLFYGENSDVWKYNNGNVLKSHERNIYSDYQNYFLTSTQGNNKRITTQESEYVESELSQSTFMDYQVIEDEDNNLIQSGKKWFGDEITAENYEENILFFPNRVIGEVSFLSTNIAARSNVSCTVMTEIDNLIMLGLTIDATYSDYIYANSIKKEFFEINIATEDFIELETTIISTDPEAKAWIDYYEIATVRNLIFTDPQLCFSAPYNQDVSTIEYLIESENSNVELWNVSDKMNTQNIDYILEGNVISFIENYNSNGEYILFSYDEILEVDVAIAIDNQNLHGLVPPEMLIITSSEFEIKAQEYASFRSNDLEVSVVNIEDIYNEFSSGIQDISAIRNYIRYLYEQEESQLTSVLLFGSASYDYLDRTENNTNYIPNWQSDRSLVTSGSIATDDFYGAVKFNESKVFNGEYAVAIGRIPCTTIEEAQIYIDKVKYYTRNSESFGDWRNRIVMVTDDEDNSIHMTQAETILEIITDENMNISKVYLDQYEQVEEDGDQISPQANLKLKEQMLEGSLIMHYVGHGNIDNWAYENIFNVNDFENLNAKNTSFVISASCEVGKYDDPAFQCLQSKMLFDENMGTIFGFTNSRIASSLANFHAAKKFYQNLFEFDMELPLGNVLIATKKNYISANYPQHFFGDPSIKLNKPKHSVFTTRINNNPVEEYGDTIDPGESVFIEGILLDNNDVFLMSFDGELSIKAFHPPILYTTFGEGEFTDPFEYYRTDSVFFETTVEVINGEFEYTIVVPNNFLYTPDEIKISYYANNDIEDANGSLFGLFAGGETTGFRSFEGEDVSANIYPNIVDDEVIVEFSGFDDNVVNMQVFDLNGRIIYQDQLQQAPEGISKHRKNLSSLDDGLYLISLNDGKQQKSFKILKR